MDQAVGVIVPVYMAEFFGFVSVATFLGIYFLLKAFENKDEE